MVWAQVMAGMSLSAVPWCQGPKVRSSMVSLWSSLTAENLPP